MRTIWKFPLVITDKQKITVPIGSNFVHCGLDPNGEPSIWYRVDPRLEAIEKDVYIVGTGNPLPDEALHHQGSFVHGPFMWHVYV